MQSARGGRPQQRRPDLPPFLVSTRFGIR